MCIIFQSNGIDGERKRKASGSGDDGFQAKKPYGNFVKVCNNIMMNVYSCHIYIYYQNWAMTLKFGLLPMLFVYFIVPLI